MAINTSYSNTAYMVRALSGMREQMEGLDRQFATGKKADTFGEMGRDRALSLGFRRQESRIAAFKETITLVSVRLKAASATLERIAAIGREAKSGLDPNRFLVQGDGTTADQKTARNYLEELTALLNSDVGGRFLFAGKDFGTRPVADLGLIFNGEGSRAGLKQVTAERRAADLGADGLGRLVLGPVAADTVTLSEEPPGGGLPFGFRLSAASSTLANATLTPPAGTPPALSVAFAGQPSVGETVSLTLALPDGTSRNITLTAATAAGDGKFVIGATATDTAHNFRAALEDALEGTGKTVLAAASALQASREFFATGPGAVAMRVSGTPPETATALVPATASNTVAWYGGDNGTGNPRDDALARVDNSVTVAYGLRANEAPFGAMFAELAALSVEDFSGATAEDSARSSAMISRMRVVLDRRGSSAVEAIEMEIAGAYRSTAQAGERHTAAASAVAGLLADVEGVSLEEVSMKMLALQTRMQASYEAAAILYRLKITDYL